MRMISQMIMPATYSKGLNYYLTAMTYSAATEDDLFFYLEQAAVEDHMWPQANGPQGSFGDTMKTWTQQAGLPMVTVQRTCGAVGGCNITFDQQMLVRAGQEPDLERKWDIPLTFIHLNSSVEPPTNSTQWFSPPNAWILSAGGPLETWWPLLDQDTPLLVNLDAFGYYRVNYDEPGWRLLAEALRTNYNQVLAPRKPYFSVLGC